MKQLFKVRLPDLHCPVRADNLPTDEEQKQQTVHGSVGGTSEGIFRVVVVEDNLDVLVASGLDVPPEREQQFEDAETPADEQVHRDSRLFRTVL